MSGQINGAENNSVKGTHLVKGSCDCSTRASLRKTSPHVRESKIVLDSGFRAVDSGLQVLHLFRIPIDAEFLELYSGFQSPGFRISSQTLAVFQNSYSISSPDSPAKISTIHIYSSTTSLISCSRQKKI